MYLGKYLCSQVHIKANGKASDIIHYHYSLCSKIVVLYFSTNGFINTAEFKITLGVNSLSLFLF